jgi:ribonuclease E
VLQNNLEAAEEIARQLRLRDIGGIIVIDFIDMEIMKNRAAVLLRLREHLAKDKTRTQVFDVSNLGLVEMTRKNVSAGLLESFSDVCPQCNGRGVVLYEEAATTGVPMPGIES